MISKEHSNEEQVEPRNWRGIILKVISLLLPVLVYASVQFQVAAQSMHEAKEYASQMYYQNWGTACIFAAVVLALLLIAYFKGAYSIFWAKANEAKLDERQLAVRNRVFLRSYRWFILLFFLASANTTAYLHSADPRVQMYTLNGLLLLAIALPSILASWHKNA